MSWPRTSIVMAFASMLLGFGIGLYFGGLGAVLASMAVTLAFICWPAAKRDWYP